MRVVHVVCSDRFAGVERHVAMLAGAQRAAGAAVAVIGGEEAQMRRTIGQEDVVFHPTDGLLQTIGTARAFARRADIVHVHMTASEVAGVVATLGTDASVVATRHFASGRGSTPINRWVGRQTAVRIRAQIAVSAFAAQYVEGPSVVIHAGVRNRPYVDPKTRERTVLVVQRLESEKRTEVAIDAFAASRLAAKGWMLLIAGTGALRGELERLAARRGVALSSRFLGHRDDIDDLMDTVGMMLAPGPSEGYGLAVVEAMAAGLPVVAAAGGGHLETVGAVSSAALFPPADVKAAAVTLRTLAEDEGSRADYGDALRTLQRQRFTLETQERATDEVYRSVR